MAERLRPTRQDRGSRTASEPGGIASARGASRGLGSGPLSVSACTSACRSQKRDPTATQIRSLSSECAYTLGLDRFVLWIARNAPVASPVSAATLKTHRATLYFARSSAFSIKPHVSRPENDLASPRLADHGAVRL